jgi:hypothetical protein
MNVADLMTLCEQALADHERATPGPWLWWTSNSFRRLSSPNGDGDVLHGSVHRIDGVVDIVGNEADKNLIANMRAREHLIASALHGLLKALVPAFEKSQLSADGFIEILEENRRLREKLKVPFEQRLCPRGALCVHEVQCPGTQR